MDTHLVRRGDPHSASPTSKQSSTATTATSPQHTNAPSPSSLNKMASVSIPLDGLGNPLPWSRDSIIQWARSSGFAKFIPAFIRKYQNMKKHSSVCLEYKSAAATAEEEEKMVT
ncbi:hypothetical protein GGI22_001106 [Coemansia erecta]|nr:hypothetical protein GGI22_001106 [Coemansia erecta]